MPSTFGKPTVESQLGLIGNALKSANETYAQANERNFQIASEQADRQIAEHALKIFNENIQPRATKQLGETGTPGTEEPGLSDYLRAGVNAGQLLSRSGGRHSQQAAKTIADIIDAKTKEAVMRPEAFKIIKRDILDASGMPIVKKDPNGIDVKQTEIVDARTNQHLGTDWVRWEPPTPRVPGGAGASQKEKDLEKYRKAMMTAKSKLEETNAEDKTALETALTQMQKTPDWPALMEAQKQGNSALQEQIIASMADTYKVPRAKAAFDYLSAKRDYRTYRELIRGYSGGPYSIDWTSGQLKPGKWADWTGAVGYGIPAAETAPSPSAAPAKPATSGSDEWISVIKTKGPEKGKRVKIRKQDFDPNLFEVPK